MNNHANYQPCLTDLFDPTKINCQNKFKKAIDLIDTTYNRHAISKRSINLAKLYRSLLYLSDNHTVIIHMDDINTAQRLVTIFGAIVNNHANYNFFDIDIVSWVQQASYLSLLKFINNMYDIYDHCHAQCQSKSAPIIIFDCYYEIDINLTPRTIFMKRFVNFINNIMANYKKNNKYLIKQNQHLAPLLNSQTITLYMSELRDIDLDYRSIIYNYVKSKAPRVNNALIKLINNIDDNSDIYLEHNEFIFEMIYEFSIKYNDAIFDLDHNITVYVEIDDVSNIGHKGTVYILPTNMIGKFTPDSSYCIVVTLSLYSKFLILCEYDINCVILPYGTELYILDNITIHSDVSKLCLINATYAGNLLCQEQKNISSFAKFYNKKLKK